MADRPSSKIRSFRDQLKEKYDKYYVLYLCQFDRASVINLVRNLSSFRRKNQQDSVQKIDFEKQANNV